LRCSTRRPHRRPGSSTRNRALLTARASDARGILRFEVVRDGEVVDPAEIEGHTVRGANGATARLEWRFRMEAEVADVEVRAVNRLGVACGPRLVTFHRSEEAPVFR
jgi:hypothetical protein